jgi:hypothetical protein
MPTQQDSKPQPEGGFDTYHHHQHHHLPKAPAPNFDTLVPDSGGLHGFSMPSPISPNTSTPSSSRSSFSAGRYRINKGYPPSLPFPHPHHHHHHHHEQTPSSSLSKHEKRRRNHLNSEKKRRENIKSGMDALFTLVPACRDQAESKANILKKTKEYILELQKALYVGEAECRRLGEENRELKRRAASCVQTTAQAGKSRSRL